MKRRERQEPGFPGSCSCSRVGCSGLAVGVIDAGTVSGYGLAAFDFQAGFRIQIYSNSLSVKELGI